MTRSREDEQFERVAQAIVPHCRLLRAWTLEGGVSAQVTALEVLPAEGPSKRLLVRRYGEGDVSHRPGGAQKEFKLLQVLHFLELPAPAPYHLDVSGEILSGPYIATEFVEGRTEFDPANLADAILQTADTLAKIHRVDCSSLVPICLPAQAEVCAEELRKGSERDAPLDVTIHQLLTAAWPLPRRNPSVLLHGDFWPGNLLWRDGRPVAVIDWEDAALGDPLADLANSRLEILWAFGADAMNDFTRRYTSVMTAIDATDLPYWDLYAGLRLSSRIAKWGVDESTQAAMREKYQTFAGQAVRLLRGRRTTRGVTLVRHPDRG